MSRAFKFSGRIAEGDLRHSTQETAPDGALIAPTYVPTTWGNVPQYAGTVQDTNTGYDPAGDCQGYFMSTNYQPNNNCYAYGCNIASNSFAQPGRASGAPSLHSDFTGDHVRDNAVSDGLAYVGTTMEELIAHAESTDNANGHYVALMFSPPEASIGGDANANWPGDYHWARCDSLLPMSWSQKDGGDQVTNFDFAGNPIIDPSVANWRVNQGPIGSGDNNEYVVTYGFFCFMYVPKSGVTIV
jgi:hypothetical protein